MPKRDALVKAYLEALGSRAVLIHVIGPHDKPALLGMARDPRLDLFDKLWFAKPAHAELVLMRCRDDFRDIGAARPEGWIDLSAREVRDHLVNTAAALGASWRTEAEVMLDASYAVAEIITHVEDMRQSGGLAQVNAAYKVYRQAQVAKGEKAKPYSAHLGAFTMSLVTLAAQNATPI